MLSNSAKSILKNCNKNNNNGKDVTKMGNNSELIPFNLLYEDGMIDLISPTRREDVGNDVWTVFNVVQEKLIQGDFDYISRTKVRKARKVKNFKQDQKIILGTSSH